MSLDLSTARNAVELLSMSVSFPGTTTALENVSFAVPRGRFVSVVGPTGCGKSTVLSCVAGLRAPTSGEVLIDGVPLRGLNRSAGYLFQQDALLPWKTVLDNVGFGLRLRGLGKRERTDRAREWIARVGLSGFEHAYPHQLSGGMRKRAAVAQMWITDPDILLMDEPFGALDVQTRQIMENELLGLWSESGSTVLFVTHDLDEAISLSDEVLVLSAGPGSRVLGRYPVDLPRPRDLLDIRTSPGYTEVYQAIWAGLRGEVVKSHV